MRKFKAANFDYCTFSGVFTTRSNRNQTGHSGLLCLDFDHVSDLCGLRHALLNDDYLDTRLLFRSPSGDGLKWVVSINLAQATHSEYFDAISCYLLSTYGVEVDPSGRDLSRACFLPCDPEVVLTSGFAR